MGGLEITVRVTPDSRRERVEKVSDREWRIAVREDAEGGRANARVRELVAREYAVEPSAVKILTGHHAQKKRIAISVGSA